jgi:TrmH family RNA methyltransferase
VAESISSVKNERVKRWAALKQKKYRELSGMFLVEGVRLVETALRAGAPVEVVLYATDRHGDPRLDPILNLAYRSNAEVIAASESVIRHIADTKEPQGIIAVCKMLGHAVDRYTFREEPGMYLIVDGVQDPGNLGAMIRLADAFRAGAVFLSRSVDEYNPKVVRATMGSLFHLPVFRVDAAQFLPRCREQGVVLVAGIARGGAFPFDEDLSGKTAFLLGNEANGLPEDLLAWCDKRVTVPMPGKAESLNAASAAGILLYEGMRQRHAKGTM